MGLGWSHPCGAPERPPNSGPTTAVPRRVVPRRVGVVRQSALGRGGAEAGAFALYPGGTGRPGVVSATWTWVGAPGFATRSGVSTPAL